MNAWDGVERPAHSILYPNNSRSRIKERPMEEEIWKDIKGYEGLYQASNFGRIKRLEALLPDKNGNKHYSPEKILKPWKHKSGYQLIGLNKYGCRKAKLIHRIIAEAFIENPHDKPQINHKDGDKTNNCVSNLEWVTNSENQRHKIYTLGKKTPLENYHRKRVRCVETGEIFSSLSDAAKAAGVKYPNIAAVCLNYPGRSTSAGCHWEYITD